MTCFNRFWHHQVVKIRSSQWNSTIFETVDCRFFGNGPKIQRRFGHKWVFNSSCRTADNNPASEFGLRVCEAFLMCVVVRSHVVCATFYVILWFASHLLLTCSSLDNDVLPPPKHITTLVDHAFLAVRLSVCNLTSLYGHSQCLCVRIFAICISICVSCCVFVYEVAPPTAPLFKKTLGTAVGNWWIYFHFQNCKCRDICCIVLYSPFVMVCIIIAVFAFHFDD